MLDDTSRSRDFPSLDGMTYLNTAAEGIPPLAAGEALAQYFRDHQRGMDGRERHYAQLDAAKQLTARMFGLSAAEVAICSCSSEAYNLAALALQLRPGDEVVINDLDFPAGSTPWLQPSSSATVKVWRSRAGALRVEDLVALLGPRTRLVTASLVSFYNGFMIPLPAVVEAVRAHSPALLALDIDDDPAAPSGWLAEELRHFCRVVRGQVAVPVGARFVDGLRIVDWTDQLERAANSP